MYNYSNWDFINGGNNFSKFMKNENQEFDDFVWNVVIVIFMFIAAMLVT